MSIECHGVDHVDLALLNAAAQQYEIDDCIRSLEGHLHDAVQAYAYPSGAFDAQTIGIEERAGLRFGFTTDPSFQTQRDSPYELTRLRVTSGMSDAGFAALISSYLEHARRRFRRARLAPLRAVRTAKAAPNKKRQRRRAVSVPPDSAASFRRGISYRWPIVKGGHEESLKPPGAATRRPLARGIPLLENLRA